MPSIPEPRIFESTTTTGTTVVDLDGAAAAWSRQFRDGYADTTSGIPYCIADAAGAFEIGFGTLDYGAGAGGKDRLTRDTVWRSSNGGAAVNWGAGTRDVFVCSVPDGVLLPANNLSDVLSAATARTNLGLGTMATQSGSGVTIPVVMASGGRVVLPVGADLWDTV